MNYKHGHTKGKRRSAEHSVWTDMHKRCNNPKHKYYSRYGGRGITVCSRWHSFQFFLADMGKRPKGHCLERLNNNGHYTPENCIWATAKQQARNRSTTLWITIGAQTKSLAEWCEERKLSYHTVFARIKSLGWDPEKALEFH